MNARVLCVDPGPHVGIAIYNRDGTMNEDDHPGEKRFSCSEWTPDDWYVYAQQWVEWAEVVVVEGFSIGGSRASSANETIEMIGVMRYLAKEASGENDGGRKFVVQMPAERKFADARKLKKLGWYRPSSADHMKSATQHLVTYLAKVGELSADQLVNSAAEVE